MKFVDEMELATPWLLPHMGEWVWLVWRREIDLREGRLHEWRERWRIGAAEKEGE